jgi:hypothetical protein
LQHQGLRRPINNKNTALGRPNFMEDVMRGMGFNLFSVVAGVFAAFAASGTAHATCTATPAGTWHFFALADRESAINTVIANARNSADTGSVSLRVFPPAGVSFAKDSAKVLKCVLTIAANGSFSNAPCTSYGDQGSVNNTTVSGTVTFSSPSCNLGGTVNIPSDTAVTIRGGHVNGVMGAGIATQGKQVLSFTLVRN